jgi:integrase
MGRKRTPGLYKKGRFWQIDKKIFGYRVCESTGIESLEEAEKYLAKRIEGMRQASVYGVRPNRTFIEAATKYLMENQHKRSLRMDAGRLRVLVEFIGNEHLNTIHMGTLQGFIDSRRREGIKTRTINHGLTVVRRILNLAATEWMDEFGLTWLPSAPKIKLLAEHDLRKPYPLNWEEQQQLFSKLPSHLENMALFSVNTGCREQEVCQLQWDWEVKIPSLRSFMVFIIPSELVKNGEERLIVCNHTALKVVEYQRGKHDKYVFTYKGEPIKRMNSTAWRNARVKAGLDHVRVHDLKHTFGRRLRAAGVSFEDRQDLLGHRSGRITTHYSSAELQNLLEASNKVCEKQQSGVVLTLLRNPNNRASSVKTGLSKIISL